MGMTGWDIRRINKVLTHDLTYTEDDWNRYELVDAYYICVHKIYCYDTEIEFFVDFRPIYKRNRRGEFLSIDDNDSTVKSVRYGIAINGEDLEICPETGNMYDCLSQKAIAWLVTAVEEIENDLTAERKFMDAFKT